MAREAVIVESVRTPLCKAHRENPELVERFEPYIAGYEVGNAY